RADQAHRSRAAHRAARLSPASSPRPHRNMDTRHTSRLRRAGVHRDAASPPIHRASMVPRPWTGFCAGLRNAVKRRLRGEPPPADAAVPADWQAAAARRRRTLLLAVGGAALGAAFLLLRA